MLPDKFYHIYNNANGSENLFRSEENYRFFLRQWAKYIGLVADPYAYCLLPNHFHFLVQVKSEAAIEESFGKFETSQTLEKKISKQFSNLFSSYTQAFNKMYNRRGSLFIPNFKKKEIDSEDYLTQAIVYIHQNPIHHGFCKGLKDWKYSSYHALHSERETRIERAKVLEWFGSEEAMIDSHANPTHRKSIREFP